MMTVTIDLSTASHRELSVLRGMLDALLGKVQPDLVDRMRSAPVAPVTAVPAPVDPVTAVPAPVATAVVLPVAPVATAVVLPETEVDVRGLPWDARIHSSAHTFMKGGGWKLKRNLDEGYVAQVEASIRAGIPAAAVPRSTPLPVAMLPVPAAPAPTLALVPFAPPSAPVAPGRVPSVVELFTEVSRHAGRTPPMYELMSTVFPGVTLPDLMTIGGEERRTEVYNWMRSIP